VTIWYVVAPYWGQEIISIQHARLVTWQKSQSRRLSLVQSRSDTARWRSDQKAGNSEREGDLDGFAPLWEG
jgi:hypothetical protein